MNFILRFNERALRNGNALGSFYTITVTILEFSDFCDNDAVKITEVA